MMIMIITHDQCSLVGKIAASNEEEQALMKKRTALILDQSTLLYPKVNSGIPGAQTNQKMPPGMEPRVTTLYLDVNGQL